ncbi:MAG: hypothetical protein ACOC1D_01590 [Prolixibacteraceae bacterium]
MKNYLPIIFLVITLFACVQEEKFPPKMSQKISDGELQLIDFDSIHSSVSQTDEKISETIPGCLKQLTASAKNYREKDEAFSLQQLKEKWESCKSEFSGAKLNEQYMKQWIETTGLLLQLTAEAKYAEELQRIFVNSANRDIKKLAASYVLTKNVDHIYVNLFVPAELNYKHSLGGDVQIRQESNYPASGKVDLHINSSRKRYIELYIRIPGWAEDAEVTVKGVKYFTPAGGYCKIAKQWREGDVVEIIFPGIHNQAVIK